MKVTIKGSYKKRNASTGAVSTVFRGEVTGTEAEIADYKETQGANLRVDEESGKPLFFTTRPTGKVFNIVKTRGSESRPAQYIPDSSEMDLQAAIVAQAGGNLGQEIAKIAASQFMFGGAPVANTAPVAKAEEAAADDLNKG